METTALYKLPFMVGVSSLQSELHAHPELWNEFTIRTEHPASPHRELSDIFVRYNARENYAGDRHAFNEPHDAVWWPAADKLPAARQLAMDLMSLAEGERLGMVLITKIPAGGKCYPHVDLGWHARHYDKYAVQIASAAGQSFHVEDQSLSADPGEVYLFDNAKRHWVVNDSKKDRITLIVCIRTRFTGN